jgi:hypothetical protein
MSVKGRRAMSFFCQFCDVAKVAIILKGRFSQIFLQAKYENKKIKNPSIFLLPYFNHV